MENDILCVRKEGGSVILPVFFLLLPLYYPCAPVHHKYGLFTPTGNSKGLRMRLSEEE